MLLNEAKKDIRSVTGSNLRNIIILGGKTSVDDVSVGDVESLPYFNLSEGEQLRFSNQTCSSESETFISKGMDASP